MVASYGVFAKVMGNKSQQVVRTLDEQRLIGCLSLDFGVPGCRPGGDNIHIRQEWRSLCEVRFRHHPSRSQTLGQCGEILCRCAHAVVIVTATEQNHSHVEQIGQFC
jgi:hypothetical protein